VTSFWRILFGNTDDYKARRSILHENRNEAQKSIASARSLRKASNEAESVAKCAITRLEQNSKTKKEDND
jgi:hypothetical protein